MASGFPEREMLQAAIDHSQTSVNGEVKLKLYKGNVMMMGRHSSSSLYSEDLVTFEEVPLITIIVMRKDLLN
ncbi:MAG: hypothetical protein CM15mP117_07250 [Alphaproteobacteria bacterium]|nr:MAG: hypothetical protein CM15mP117_07250 [Alphaproteobacteria bacterium]